MAAGAAVDGEDLLAAQCSATGASTSATWTASYAGGHEHEAEGLGGTGRLLDNREHRHAEGERLAGPGAGPAAHVPPGHRDGDRLDLDLERLGEAGRGKSVVDARRHAELGEPGRRLDGGEDGDGGEVGGRRGAGSVPAEFSSTSGAAGGDSPAGVLLRSWWRPGYRPGRAPARGSWLGSPGPGPPAHGDKGTVAGQGTIDRGDTRRGRPGSGGPRVTATGREADDIADLAHVRRGDRAAYDAGFARRVGRRPGRGALAARDPVAAEDAVSEALAQTYAAIRRGRGPVDGFHAYLLRSVRHQCFRTWRLQSRLAPGIEPAPAPAADGLDEQFRREVMCTAFRGLPSRMRLVLWRTEVEGCSHAEIAEQLKTTPQAVAALAVRARRRARRRLPPGTRRLGVGDRSARPSGATSRPWSGAPPAPGRRRPPRSTSPVARRAKAAHDELVVINERLRTAPLGGALASLGGVGPIAVGARVASLLAITTGGLVPVAGVLTLSLAVVAAEPVAADDAERDGAAAAVALEARTPPPLVVGHPVRRPP